MLHLPPMVAGLVPFLVALAVAELLQRPRLSGLSVAAGFAVTAYLLGELTPEPHSAAQKIVFLGLASALVALPLSAVSSIWLRPVLAILAGLAALWVTLHQLLQFQPAAALLWSAGLALYAGWLVVWMDYLEYTPVRAGSAGLSLALGTGLVGLAGDAALPGMFGLSLAAGAGAYLLIQIITNSDLPGGRSLTLPLALISGLSGALAVLSARLPWYTLLPLAAIPLLARLPVSDRSAVWLQALALLGATLACAAAAVYLTGHLPFAF